MGHLWVNPPAFLDDFLIGGFLIAGAWATGNASTSGSRRSVLAAAWGFACGMAYSSITSHWYAMRTGVLDPAPIPTAWVFAIKLFGGLLFLAALLLTLTPRDNCTNRELVPLHPSNDQARTLSCSVLRPPPLRFPGSCSRHPDGGRQLAASLPSSPAAPSFSTPARWPTISSPGTVLDRQEHDLRRVPCPASGLRGRLARCGGRGRLGQNNPAPCAASRLTPRCRTPPGSSPGWCR